MHDAGAPGQPERLRERPRRVARRRVHDHARRLVDDEQQVVLVGDRERDLLGGGLAGRRLVARRLDRLPRSHAMALGPHGAVDGDPPGVDQALRAGARPEGLTEHHVETLAGLLVSDRDPHRGRTPGRSRPR